MQDIETLRAEIRENIESAFGRHNEIGGGIPGIKRALKYHARKHDAVFPLDAYQWTRGEVQMILPCHEEKINEFYAEYNKVLDILDRGNYFSAEFNLETLYREAVGLADYCSKEEAFEDTEQTLYAIELVRWTADVMCSALDGKKRDCTGHSVDWFTDETRAKKYFCNLKAIADEAEKAYVTLQSTEETGRSA